MKRVIFFMLIVLMIGSCGTEQYRFDKSWTTIDDRVWVGAEFWSNRLQDWKIQNGRLECVANESRLMMRTTHLINCRLAESGKRFSGRVETGALQTIQNSDAACGFLLGAGPGLDVWGASLVQQKAGPGGGLFAGISSGGELFIRDMVTGETLKTVKIVYSEINILSIDITTKASEDILTIESGDSRLTLSDIGDNRITGNIALVSHPGTGDNPGSFWFNNLEIGGDRLEELNDSFGPIVSTQYTLSNNTLKLTAQMVPVGEGDPQVLTLEVKGNNSWREISNTSIIKPGYTATFKVQDWDSSIDIPFRVKYIYRSSDNDKKIDYHEGTIRHDPVEKEEIVIAGFTGNHNIAHPGLSGTNGTFNFDSSGIWYPHREVVQNVSLHQPDLLFFSGDQVYEGNSPTSPDRQNYELDYLYKWYLYCLAYRDLLRDIPTISIPDDHDVYQGNVWGQGGRPVDVDNKGGYVHPAWFVRMVDRTQCSNLPDPYDPTPIDQNIGVYYTSLTYGGIGFAVIEDRKFKSGCADNPFITKGRPDHVIDPNFDTKKIDLPGKVLLGDRQLDFLSNWATTWNGQEMKIALSQTIFANMATHHGGGLFRLIADLDSNGWPQSGRNKAIDALRKAFAFHLAGDQHLASIVHHGINEWGDGIYSFCVPSVANFYPRAWWPENMGVDRPDGASQNMGKHRDGFGNLVTVYAVTNPTGFSKISTNHEPLSLHDKMPGYGIVRMNKSNRTIKIECWPRYADPEIEEQQYEGWPKTISQFDNYGRKAYAYLPTIRVEGTIDPVIEISDEVTGEIVYCVRIKGTEFKPKVFKEGSYTVTMKETEKGIEKVFNNIKPASLKDETIVVSFQP